MPIDERRVQEGEPPVKSWFITQSKCRHIHLNPNCELILSQLLTLKSPLYPQIMIVYPSRSPFYCFDIPIFTWQLRSNLKAMMEAPGNVNPATTGGRDGILLVICPPNDVWLSWQRIMGIFTSFYMIFTGIYCQLQENSMAALVAWPLAKSGEIWRFSAFLPPQDGAP